MTFEFSILPSTLHNNVSPIILNIDLLLANHQRFTFKTSLRIESDQWDTEKQRPINIYKKKYSKINHKLDELKIRISQYLKEALKEGRIISERIISKEIKKICLEKTIDYPELSLLHFIKMYIEAKEDLISPATYKRYHVFMHFFQKFEGFIAERLYLEKLDSKFIKDFISFGKHEGYSENTIYRSIHFVRTILNFAERKGIRTPIRELEIKREKPQREIITLTEKEISAIKKTELPSELQSARDWLLVSCYTGQRISDFMNFSEEKIVEIEGKKCINFIQKKTGKNVILPLHQTVLNIIVKNNGQFPKKINSIEYNKQIRKIAEIAGIKDTIKVNKRIGFRTINISLEKWQTLSSHIGRRSFATIFYGKIPTPLLMHATGHSTEQMFLKYINPTDNSKIIRLSRYFDSIYKKDTDNSFSLPL